MIKDFIKDNVVNKSCDYCGKSSDTLISAPVDDVLVLIMEGIHSEWVDPNKVHYLWDSEGGGWQGKDIDSEELIIGKRIVPANNESLLKDILGSIEGNEWCTINYCYVSSEEVLTYGWKEFSWKVKHHSRYFFLESEDDEYGSKGFDEIPPSAMLDRLGTVISEVKLINELKKGENVFRVRIHESETSLNLAKELGPPKQEESKYANRMSSAGISMFYGAFSKDTAINETYEKGHGKHKVATIATFELLRTMQVLDLTRIPILPSLYDKSKRDFRANIKFLNSFVNDVSKPIKKDGREHIEYVPTQVFTEYFRFIYRTEDGKRCDGIIYQSAKQQDGLSCVLFIEDNNCCDSLKGDSSDIDKFLILKKTERQSLSNY